jgi:hypothetical protein
VHDVLQYLTSTVAQYSYEVLQYYLLL